MITDTGALQHTVTGPGRLLRRVNPRFSLLSERDPLMFVVYTDLSTRWATIDKADCDFFRTRRTIHLFDFDDTFEGKVPDRADTL